MEHVVLTSHILDWDWAHHLINTFLGVAAAVALMMPKLKTMELWNCGRGRAAIFPYEDLSRPERPEYRLTWRSTWLACPEVEEYDEHLDLVVEPAVIRAWEGVARAHGHDPESVRFECDPLPVGGDREREYASGYELLRKGVLKLGGYVLCDTSRAQAAAELEMTDDAYAWHNAM